MDSSPEASAFQVELERFRDELFSHFRREEALFATVKQAVAARADLANDVLATFLSGEAESDLQAHEALTSLMNKMLVLLKEGEAGVRESRLPNRLREMLDATLRLLRSHANNEDKIIFPIIAHVLREELEPTARKQFREKEKSRSLHL